MSEYLKLFENNEERFNYEFGNTYVTPYVSAIKEENGGGVVNPHYNIPNDILCAFISVDNSITYITGEGEITSQQVTSYSQKNAIKSVILTDRCTGIGDYTFFSCPVLTSITISNTVTSIGVSSLSYTPSLKHISLPNSLKEIKSQAFENCGLTELIIPEGTKSIGNNSVRLFDNLETIVLPSSLEEIGDNLLDWCPKIKTVKVYGKGSRIWSGLSSFLKGTNEGATLYVDSSLLETYKEYRDTNGGKYKILPLQQ